MEHKNENQEPQQQNSESPVAEALTQAGVQLAYDQESGDIVVVAPPGPNASTAENGGPKPRKTRYRTKRVEERAEKVAEELAAERRESGWRTLIPTGASLIRPDLAAEIVACALYPDDPDLRESARQRLGTGHIPANIRRHMPPGSKFCVRARPSLADELAAAYDAASYTGRELPLAMQQATCVAASNVARWAQTALATGDDIREFLENRDVRAIPEKELRPTAAWFQRWSEEVVAVLTAPRDQPGSTVKEMPTPVVTSMAVEATAAAEEADRHERLEASKARAVADKAVEDHRAEALAALEAADSPVLRVAAWWVRNGPAVWATVGVLLTAAMGGAVTLVALGLARANGFAF